MHPKNTTLYPVTRKAIMQCYFHRQRTYSLFKLKKCVAVKTSNFLSSLCTHFGQHFLKIGVDTDVWSKSLQKCEIFTWKFFDNFEELEESKFSISIIKVPFVSCDFFFWNLRELSNFQKLSATCVPEECFFRRANFCMVFIEK